MRPDLSLRVALGADAIEPESTGIGRYSFELARRLPTHRAIRSMALIRGNETFSSLGDFFRHAGRRSIISRSVGRLKRLRSFVPRYDVLHGPNYSLPAGEGGKVATIHDLSVFRFPQFHPADRVAHFEQNFERVVRDADHLITDCEAIRREVIEFTNINPTRITSIALGVSTSFRPISRAERQEVIDKYGLPRTGYGLSVSSLEPRKRIDRLLRAWRTLPKPLRDRHPIVIVGAKGWKNEALHREIESAKREGWAMLLGFVADRDLPAIYSGASAFIFPSAYEGFGLPPLEAMACGVPTVVAREPCLEEVTRGASLLCDPENDAEFGDAIRRAVEDDLWRKTAISAGIQVASGYTWKKCVDETVDVYQRVSSGSRNGRVS